MPDLFTLRPTKFVPASSLKIMNAPLSERPTLALTLSDISSRDCRDSESLFQKRRSRSLIVDVDSVGTPVEHYAHIMAVYADKMPPNPVLHDNGLASVQRILAKADSLFSSVSETVFDDRYIASRCAVVRESNGAYHVAT